MTVAVAPSDKRPFPLRVAGSRRSLLPRPGWHGLSSSIVQLPPSPQQCIAAHRDILKSSPH